MALYPHYEGYNLDHIVRGEFNGKTWTETASFVQRWAYWGMIQEVLSIGGMVTGESLSLRSPSDTSSTETLQSFSQSLPYLLLLWNHIRSDREGPERERDEQQRFVEISVVLKRVNQFYDALCSVEKSGFHSRRDRRGADQGPEETQLLYARHSHLHEEVEGWDERFAAASQDTKTFFSEEPIASSVHPLESAGHALVLSIGLAGELLSRATEHKYGRSLHGLKWTFPLAIIRRVHLAGWCPV